MVPGPPIRKLGISPTGTTYSSELISLAKSTAFWAASSASSEPSIASRILVGKLAASRRGSGRKARNLYSATRHYHTDPGSADEFARRVNEKFMDIMSDMPGFVAYFVLTAR